MRRHYAYISYGSSLGVVLPDEKFPDWQTPAAVHACREADVELLRLVWDGGRPHPVGVYSPDSGDSRGANERGKGLAIELSLGEARLLRLVAPDPGQAVSGSARKRPA